MTRHVWVLLHRYAGLAMTVFLILVGVTGSVLAFYHELDRWLNPELLTVPVR
ncbi:MAG: PepSY domain-containing protein, partial [Gammaproteobacteria bacterium]